MSELIREGTSWLLITHIDDLKEIKDCIATVTEQDWSNYTSAQGPNSVQNYIINPKWMPSNVHKEPENWHTVKKFYEDRIKKELIFHALMPGDWQEPKAVAAWTVKGYEGSYHTIHDHGPANICSVTYLSVPEPYEPPKGDTYFVLDAGGYSPLSPPQKRIIHVTPKEGLLVIFPAFILHGVYPQGPGLRQTLNIDFNGTGEYQLFASTASKTTVNYIP